MAAPAGLTRTLASGRIWLDGPSRLSGLDLARGLAVIGMLAAHLLSLPSWSWTDPATWGAVAEGRSSILFALCAGVSIALVTGGMRPVTGAERTTARFRLGVRAGLLWILGLLLVLTGIPAAVILPAYAILFLLALPFVGLRPRTLLVVAGIVALVAPWPVAFVDALPFWQSDLGFVLTRGVGWAYPFPVWLAFLLAGMGIGRLDLRAARTAARLVAAGTALALVGYGLDAATGAPPAHGHDSWVGAAWTAAPHSSGVLEAVGSGGVAIAVLGGCLLVCRLRGARLVLLPLRATGAMPLSAYTGQLLAWALLAAVLLGDTGGLSAFRALHPFVPMTLVLVAACTAWALLLGRGPLERLVSAVTRALVG